MSLLPINASHDNPIIVNSIHRSVYSSIPSNRITCSFIHVHDERMIDLR